MTGIFYAAVLGFSIVAFFCLLGLFYLVDRWEENKTTNPREPKL